MDLEWHIEAEHEINPFSCLVYSLNEGYGQLLHSADYTRLRPARPGHSDSHSKDSVNSGPCPHPVQEVAGSCRYIV